jgi:hypothetical protein
MKKLVLILPLLVAAGFAQELLTNGDFEQDLSVGWTQSYGGLGTPTFDRSTAYQPDLDFEARCSLYSGAGWCRLGQTVDVPGPTLALSFWASFADSGTSSTCWPVAYVSVVYKDADGNALGETRVYHHDAYCTWFSGPTLHLIDVPDHDWHEYTLDIASELNTNLPGVNAGDVNKVEVALADTTAGG